MHYYFNLFLLLYIYYSLIFCVPFENILQKLRTFIILCKFTFIFIKHFIYVYDFIEQGIKLVLVILAWIFLSATICLQLNTKRTFNLESIS